MKDNVTQQEAEQYQRDGFIVFDNFLSPAELEVWRKEVDEAVAAREEYRLPGKWDSKNDSDTKKILLQRINLWMDHPGVRKLMLDERLGRMAADLANVDGMRIWHDQAIIKLPWGAPTDWHMDNPYWSFTSPNAISIWVALDDATPDNGCLYFLPGSQHVEVVANPNIGTNMSALFDSYPEQAKVSAVCAQMKAGSCSFHNGRTFHAAQANMTPRPRRAMTCAYMPDGSVFNGAANVLPEEYLATLKVGDKIEDGRHVPLLYSRSGKKLDLV